MTAWGRDRMLAMGSLIAVTALCWLYLARMTMSRDEGSIICTAAPGLAGTPLEQFAPAFPI